MKILNRLLPALILLALLTSCKKKFETTNQSAEEIGRYIAARVPALIDAGDPVRVRFSVIPDTTVTASVVEFNPPVEGSTYWEDAMTIAFRPDKGWQPGKTYQLRLHLDKVIKDVDPGMKQVVFEFEVRPLRVHVQFEPLVPEFEGDAPRYLLRGRLTSSAPLDSLPAQKMLQLKSTGEMSGITWFHSEDRRTHEFVISNIHPDGSLNFSWDGQNAGSKEKGSRKILVPKANELVVLGVETTNDGQRKIEVHFSQKLEATQDVKGLVTLNGDAEGITVRKQGHILSIYPADEMMNGTVALQLHSSIASAGGHTLGQSITMDIALENAKPALRLVGSGVITPGTAEIVFPFEAINLHTVRLEVFRVFENNILQYLQHNSLEDQWGLEPVGHIILQKEIDLSSLSDGDNKSVWKRYALDLAPLVRLAPGSIYQVRLGFTGADTYMDCYQDISMHESKAPYGEMVSMWEYDYSYDGFTWEHTEDPCYPAYYNPEKFIRRNILSSDIGLTAKQNDVGKLWAYASSITKAGPKAGIEIEVYDYQQQLLIKGKTSGSGEFVADLPRKAFFVIAIEGDQRGYLRMADGLSLSLSEFEVGGTGYQEGLRGYIYTERDVWRPGDSVHLNFILWDPEGKIDNRHPVQLSVTNPLGQKKAEKTSPLSVGGIYDLAFATSSTDPTGTWMARVSVGDAEFSKALRIETVKPNRLRIDAKLPKSIVADIPDQKIDLEAAWLFGAPASNLKAIVEAQFSPGTFQPEGYRDFRFTDPARTTPSTVTTIFEGNLDAQGKARINVPDIRESLPDGPLTMSIKTRVFETGGDFSTDRHSTTYHPYSYYAGVSIPANRWGYEELKIGEQNQVRLASVNTAGKGIANRSLSVGIYNAQWRWWWDRMGQDITQYNSKLHIGAIATDTVVTGSNGTVTYNINPSTYGSYMIRVCDTESGHCSGQFYYAGSWGDPSNASSAASRLTFAADKDQYEVGEKIKINVPSASGSKLLLTIEKNNKVISSKWYDATGEQTQITLDATAEMMPNVYAFVSHIQSYDHGANDMPLRMYGVIPIMVADPKTMLHPQLTVADVLRPDEVFTVSVSEQNKQAMAYTIAVVDEGLLGLTRFESPDPWSHFHQQEALAVQTWDMYDHVLGGYGGALDRLLSIGGDGVAALVDAPQAQRFTPVVMHLGPYYLNAGEKKDHKIKMPNYVGAVRVMLVASDRKRWGSAEKSVAVKSDLMIQPTLPRLVSPGETVILPVNVYAMSDLVKNVELKVTTNNMATVSGGGSQSISFQSQGDKLASFSIKIPERPGLLKVSITATSGNIKTSQELELDVRIPNPPATEVISTVISAGQKWTGKVPVVGMTGTNEASVELSQMPAINLQKRLTYLIQYPYGCLEQTLSSVFPQLYLAELTELSPQQQQLVRSNIQAGINRLRTFTLPSGGFTYWPGERSRDSWSHSYAGHFLIEASKAGYAVDAAMMNGWRNAQKKDAQAYRPRDFYREDVIQAYRLYTLALDGQPLWGMMNRLRAEPNIDPVAAWLLAGAYAIGKRNDVAQTIIDKLSTDVKPYQELAYTYGSDIRDKAIILETFLHMGKRNDAMDVAQTIASAMGSDQWYSTQSTSFSLLALGKLARQFSGDPMKATLVQGSSSAETMTTTKRIMSRALSVSGETVTIENTSSDPLYIRITSTGRPLKGIGTEIKNNLSLKARYMSMDGKEISPDKLTQGRDFIVHLSVTNPGTFTTHLDQMALAYLFPSGWELTNPRMDQFRDRFNNSPMRYQDIRDDRVNTFFSMDRGVANYYFIMTATYAGRYWLPDIMCEAMYSNQVRARLPGRWVEVVAAAGSTEI